MTIVFMAVYLRKRMWILCIRTSHETERHTPAGVPYSFFSGRRTA